MNDQVKTEQPNEAHISPSELNAGLGCTCLETLRGQLKDKVFTDFAKPNDPVFNFEIRHTMTGRAIVNMYVYRVKQMKPVDTFIVADFCPWCGAKY